MATTFDARQAATVLREMEGYEEGLRRRTEGVTWMIWSLVFAGIAMSYWTMSLVSPAGSPDAAEVLPDRGLVTPWIGWVVAGGLATRAVWGGAALKEDGARNATGLRHVAALAAIMVEGVERGRARRHPASARATADHGRALPQPAARVPGDARRAGPHARESRRASREARGGRLRRIRAGALRRVVRVRYRITARGSDAFRAYLSALRSMLEVVDDPVRGASSTGPSPSSPSRAPD